MSMMLEPPFVTKGVFVVQEVSVAGVELLSYGVFTIVQNSNIRLFFSYPR